MSKKGTPLWREAHFEVKSAAERKLSLERRRVLKHPGVVAWFTGYKMELFYKHVLKYEDGEGVFEWGAGGIMHLHSINFDPAQDEWRLPCAQSIRAAQEFAPVHEEYVTDWSLAKQKNGLSKTLRICQHAGQAVAPHCIRMQNQTDRKIWISTLQRHKIWSPKVSVHISWRKPRTGQSWPACLF